MHTGFSPDSATELEGLVSRCLKTGLNCIAVTDHNTIQGALAAQSLAPFRVIVGEEIKSAGGEIVGLFLQEAIPAAFHRLRPSNSSKTRVAWYPYHTPSTNSADPS